MRRFFPILVVVAVVTTACGGSSGGGETPVAATPTFSPAGGTYTAAQSVTISTTTPGATIYYTTDGSTPTTASAVYGGAVAVSASGALKAIATAPGYTASAVGTASYVIAIIHAFDGTWAVCRNDLDPPTDYREIFTIDGASASGNLIFYDTVDVSCDGDGVSDTPQAMTAVYGDQVTAGLGAGTVQATKVDVTVVGSPTFYTLLYRDTAATPEVLHLGDDSGTLDGSTALLRPVNLQAMARALQTAPGPGDLTGEWRFCPAAADGNIVKFDAANGTFDATKYTGTCAAGTVREHVAGTYTLATPVYASLGATTVTAFAVDLDITAGPFVGSFYTTFWVDTQASPRRLFGGDDTLHGMDGSTASLRPRVLSTIFYVKQ